MHVLVAGGAGLIGSNLCEALLERGHEVTCVDNLSTGCRRNIEPFVSHPRFRFVHHDIVRKLPPFGLVDRIYHLASPASPVGYVNLPIETLRVNSEGTLRLLELARDHEAGFLFSSTSEVYGDPLQHPQAEDYRGNVSSIGPRSMYDEAKRYAEALIMAFVRSGQADARVVRIFNTYGPRCRPDDGRVVGNLIVQALRGEPMTIYGDGRQTRSLCYVSDLVEGLIATMESPAARGEVINLGNPDERSVIDYAHLIRELIGSPSEFVFTRPAVGDDPQVRCPDIGKARAMLGWSPRVELREGLARTIAYLRDVLEAEARLLHDAAAGARANNGAATNGFAKNGVAKNGVAKNGVVKNGVVKNGVVKNGVEKNGLTAKNGSAVRSGGEAKRPNGLKPAVATPDNRPSPRP